MSPASPAPIIEVVDVAKTFALGRERLLGRRKTLRALAGVNLTVAAGEALGIVGESGCGKSTLARVMVRLLEPDRGRVLFHGGDLSGADHSRNARTRLQMVFQDPYSSLNPRMTVGRAIEEPLRAHRIVPGEAVVGERNRLMERVGLSPRLAARLPRELSGGQRQRVSIATILHKREGYRRAFAGFDPDAVAAFTDEDVERLLGDASIVRNRLKVRSAVENARAVVTLREETTLDALLWSFVGGTPLDGRRKRLSDIPAETPDSRAMSKELKRRGFRFVGPTVCYAFMQACGLVNDHVVSCFRYEELRGAT